MFKRKMNLSRQKLNTFVNEFTSVNLINTPVTFLEEKETAEQLENIIKNLPEKYRSVYVLREIEGLSIKEVADCLSISKTNVKIRTFRARNMIKDSLPDSFNLSDLFPFGNQRRIQLMDNVKEKIYPKYR
jgi:RNA polymerase sigma factor (sigma-70 family)